VLAATNPSERNAILLRHVRNEAAAVLGMTATALDYDLPLSDAGLDSLMTLTLTRKLGKSLGLNLSPTLIFNYPTLAALASYLDQELSITTVPKAPVEAGNGSNGDGVIADFRTLSEAEAGSVVNAELAKLLD